MRLDATTVPDMSTRLGRNDPCPCGSGKKFKHCHGVPTAPAPLRALSSSDIGALVTLINQDRLAEAETQARAAIASHPGAGMLWKVLSVALVRQGKDALQALNRTVELLPDDAEALRNLGAALHDRGEWAAALEILQRALRIEPDNPDALVDAADALRGLGRTPEAIPLYERALSRDPRQLEAQNNLGNAFLETGEHAKAADAYRRALEIKPRDAQILVNLSNALRRLGNLDEAAASYRQALRSNPNYVEALSNLGDVLRDLGDRQGALPLYRRAVELEPNRPENHCNLGNVLFELRQVGQAVASFQQALALRRDYAPAHLGLAFALRQQRRPEDAEVSCRAALNSKPDYVEALSFLGELQADRGQFEAAEKLFRQAIELKPDFSFALASIATHRKMTPDEAEWLRSAQALLTKPLALGHEISLRYAVGKYFDDLKQYDEAFGQYRAANELTKRYGVRYDGAKLTERIGRIIDTFPAPDAGRPPPAADDPRASASTNARPRMPTAAAPSASELPVFIVGMPRSGTSLAEQILASHPAVFGAGEVTFWNAAWDSYLDAERRGNKGADLIPGMAAEYLRQLTSVSGGAQRVVDKLPANAMYAGLIHAAFPRARIIHMRRHPLDTCLSIYFQNFFNIGPWANDLNDLAHYYGEYLRVTSHWRKTLPPTALLEVPYESLIADQESWSRRMVEFIGLPWDPRCLDFHQTQRVVITASRWQVRQQITATSAGRWRNYEKHVAPLRHLIAAED